MSYKASVNGIKLTRCDSNNDANVKLAGEEAKDRLYEPKHKKKLIRVLTVIAYVFFVSLAAIMLSLYYVFLWNGNQKVINKYVSSPQVQIVKCGGGILAERQRQMTDLNIKEFTVLPTETTTGEETTTWINYESKADFDEFSKKSIFMNKILFNQDYDGND